MLSTKVNVLIKTFRRLLSVRPTMNQDVWERKEPKKPEEPISKHVIQTFSAYFPTFLKGILDDKLFKGMSPFDKERLEEMLVYNLPYGYRRTPFIMLSSYFDIQNAGDLIESKLDLAYSMAWCLHMLQWSYQIVDDITDKTITRDTKPCWYRTKDNGLHAINDSCLLNSLIARLLRRYFSGHKHYHEMVHLFNNINLMSALGQQMDLTTCPWPHMTLERWTEIACNKTAWHQSVLPFKSALYLTETFEAETFRRMEPLLLDIGILFQMTNDYLDGFPTEALPGSSSTDIQEGKCSWLLVHALKLCTPSQKRIIYENYGIRDELSIKKVLDLYVELGLKEYGQNYKEQLFLDINKRIDEYPENYPKRALANSLRVGHEGY